MNKMQNLNNKYVLFLISLLIITAACKKKGDDKENAFIANETMFLTPNGYLEIYSPEEDGGDFDIILTDGEYISDSSEYSNYNTAVYFDLKSPSTTELSAGEYVFDTDWPPNSFDYASVTMYGKAGVTFDVTDGTVTITKSGDTYEISYELTMGNITPVSGYFKGSLEEIDHTQ
jgi:hypothetical protein